MAYQNQKVKARQVVTPTVQTQDLGIVSNVPMGDWNALTPYQKLNIVRYRGASYIAQKDSKGVEPTVTTGWQTVWQPLVYDGGAVEPTGNYPGMTVGNATNAENDGNGENIVEQFAEINEKIPSSASAENPLADQAFVNSSINAMAAFYITYNASGAAFPTRAALLGASTYYYGGQVRTPTQNDYAIVLADESQPQGVDGKYPTTRYSYQGSSWSFQYVVNNTSLTQAQVNAINSGITNELVEQIGANAAGLSQKVDKSGGTMTGALNAPSVQVNGKEVYSPENPPPASSVVPNGNYPQMSVGTAKNATSATTAQIALLDNANRNIADTANQNLYNLGLYDTIVSSVDGIVTITRQTGYAYLNGSEDWNAQSVVSGSGKYRMRLPNGAPGITSDQISNAQYYKANCPLSTPNATWGNAGFIEGVAIEYTDANVLYYSASFNTSNSVAAFKTWLSQNPILLQYKLNTAYTEKVIANQPLHSINNVVKYTGNGATSASGQTDTVVRYYRSSDGKSWYRVWASGWKECGGEGLTSGGSQTITLPISSAGGFSTATYTVVITPYLTGNTDKQMWACRCTAKTTSTMTVYQHVQNGSSTNTSSAVYNYYCCGY